ncbi:hypothetical protein CLIB1423_16S02762 [[Candida] railenensis]|uniref:Uncharacterized protein n=1 Tax=[Candida] railenensis TaxID=45579 RepID=A0A9P0QS12_9ASCO|nr:hypothetical protein CLIB1423_16S02762 [[Candida] railenensis]
MLPASLSRIVRLNISNTKIKPIPLPVVETKTSPIKSNLNFKFPFELPPSVLSNHKYYYNIPKTVPVSAREDELPALPTDIKGIDSSAYRFLNRKKNTKTVPTLVSGKYFQLKFYPDDHLLCIARKSNIAYTFTNSSGGFVFNNAQLSEQFKSYNGKYKRHLFFNKVLSPLNSAVKRVLFRRIVKRGLFNSLHKYVQPENVESEISKVRGVYQFRLFVIPKNEQEKQEVQSAIDNAIEKILSGKLKLETPQVSPREKEEFRKSLRLYKSPGEKNVRGYSPKFPFLRK